MVVNAPTSNITSAAELAVGAAAGHRPQHRRRPTRRSRTAQWKRSEVQRRRAAREDRRHRRPRPDRRARRRAAQRLRHEARSPTTRTSPAPRAGQLGVRLVGLDELLARERLHHRPPAEDAGDRRPDRRGGSCARSSRPCASSTPPAAASSTRRRWPPRIKRGPGRRRRHRRLRQGALHRSPAVRARRRSSSRRTSAPPPTRPRRRPASPWPGRCGSRSAASWCPDAVNVSGGVIAEDVRPGIAAGREARPDLHRARRRGRRSSSTSRCAARSPRTTSRLELAALKGLFTDVVEDAGVLRQRPAARRASAASRSRLLTDAGQPGLPQRHDAARHARRRHRRSSVSGTLTGPKHGREARRHQRLRPRGPAVRPHARSSPTPTARASIGTVGRLLGDAGVNIAGMQVARTARAARRSVVAHRRRAVRRPSSLADRRGRSAPRPSRSST